MNFFYYHFLLVETGVMQFVPNLKKKMKKKNEIIKPVESYSARWNSLN